MLPLVKGKIEQAQSRARRRRIEKEGKRVERLIQDSRAGAKRAAVGALAMIRDPSNAPEIREAIVLASYRECGAAFGPEGGRLIFLEMFGEDLLRWMDDRPASTGRLDQYVTREAR